MKRSTGFILFACLSTLAAGCVDESGTSLVEARDPAEPYPATGVTREIDLTVEDVDWEVGPYAIYKATGYNGQVPGPPIEVNAGDHVVVHLKNDTSAPHSIHTHVVKFTNENDGTGDSIVQPGETGTVEWDAVFAGSFPYHDHAGEGEGIGLGLFGMLIVHAPDEAPANEHLVVLSDFDPANYAMLPGVADPVTGEFPEGGTYHGGHGYMHTINGKAYEDAVPPFTGKVGELSRWRVISIGTEVHTWHIHGHRWVSRGELTDNVELAPGMYTTFDFEEDSPGEWLVHCHVPTHMEGGMMAKYVVSP